MEVQQVSWEIDLAAQKKNEILKSLREGFQNYIKEIEV